ncbi:hypothetical protein J2736_002076 [Paenibacillus qinlingensis]|uniref:Uncharacterized protein n=1 Tax=Paenibacillus qinlingensis TaxID=1837343 RepID=A0ABU1NTU4_9BACL|nr:hypothetical protein [Paenibacillus qinlingensis]
MILLLRNLKINPPSIKQKEGFLTVYLIIFVAVLSVGK